MTKASQKKVEHAAAPNPYGMQQLRRFFSDNKSVFADMLSKAGCPMGRRRWASLEEGGCAWRLGEAGKFYQAIMTLAIEKNPKEFDLSRVPDFEDLAELNSTNGWGLSAHRLGD